MLLNVWVDTRDLADGSDSAVVTVVGHCGGYTVTNYLQWVGGEVC